MCFEVAICRLILSGKVFFQLGFSRELLCTCFLKRMPGLYAALVLAALGSFPGGELVGSMDLAIEK